MKRSTHRLMAELQAMLAQEPADDAEDVARLSLVAAACSWSVSGTVDRAEAARIAERLDALPDSARLRVLAAAPHCLLAEPTDLPGRLEGLHQVLAVAAVLARTAGGHTGQGESHPENRKQRRGA